ncbi:MAG: hypothetical protein ABSE18_02345 [Minisyncoccia bacterium]|jgi:hypothetical protein
MSKRFIAAILGLFALTAIVFFYTLYRGSELQPQAFPVPPPNATPLPTAPTTPGATFTVYKSKNGNIFVVRWQNLPEDTVALNILRNGAPWQSIPVSPNEIASGSAKFNIGKQLFSNDVFSLEAVSGRGASNNLWSSSSTTPTISTSTPPNNSPSSSEGTTISSSSTNLNQTSSTPATNQNPPLPPSPSPSSSSSSTSSAQGIPYYTPEIQISGYGEKQSGEFWVQHVDQKIQIGWQDLPSQATSIVIFRSPNNDGPWVAMLTQANPGGTYSLQIVDNTLGLAYYYEMNALAGSTTIATYGPVYLPAVGQ